MIGIANIEAVLAAAAAAAAVVVVAVMLTYQRNTTFLGQETT